jgi:hypothetical protein
MKIVLRKRLCLILRYGYVQVFFGVGVAIDRKHRAHKKSNYRAGTWKHNKNTDYIFFSLLNFSLLTLFSFFYLNYYL